MKIFLPHLDFTPQINTLTYELPSSIEVAFGRAGGSQMALIKGGSLDAKQLTMIRTIVSRKQTNNLYLLFRYISQIQEKLNGDRKTKKMQVTIMNNSTIKIVLGDLTTQKVELTSLLSSNNECSAL